MHAWQNCRLLICWYIRMGEYICCVVVVFFAVVATAAAASATLLMYSKHTRKLELWRYVRFCSLHSSHRTIAIAIAIIVILFEFSFMFCLFSSFIFFSLRSFVRWFHRSRFSWMPFFYSLLRYLRMFIQTHIHNHKMLMDSSLLSVFAARFNWILL